ncbi:MAG: undecaprenyl-diphosphooligosaccharide--protein glycosyltransferase [Sulfurimonas sp.]|jgi:undecaprenyl-diphosphooligosaccharide--protein glycosyltransferase|uniref:STT3 domain-containing protein n=1 Tax=Sulfurimonas sp. TaxID=2022749 RepID=UPI0039E649FA
MNNLTLETKQTILYILIAFTFSVLMRMIWIYQFQDLEAFKYAGQFMINTNDGYFWAEGARDILSGTSQDNDLSPITWAPSQLTAFLAFILPFSFESIILYMPVFLSSLVVIPIILIARDLKNLDMGLIAALLASIAWSYYNRTMVGYYDTDMLNIVLPMFLLWAIIWAIDTNEDRYLLIAAVDILVYRWWYPQSYSLEFSFFGLILFYTLVFDRKNLYNYKLLAIMMLAMLNIDGLIRLPLLLTAFYIFKKENFQKFIYPILGISIVLFFVSGGFDPIWLRLKIYIFAGETIVNETGLNLHFFAVMQTVREAGKIPFETFANRISGHTITFILSFIGYLFLVYRHKIMLLSLPMIGLGFLASLGGLRFTIYAVPILAFGIAFLITEITAYITDKKSVRYLSYVVLTLAILFPNYQHIDEYKVPTVMNSDEVATLDVLKSKANREDYVISWWDYGYPIRYYSDVKTLGDGAKHSGSVNFPLSFMLTSPAEESAKMARLDVEFTEKAFAIAKKNQDLNESDRVKLFTNIEEMTKQYGFTDTNDFLLSLGTDIELPKKTRDIYFYLPFKMLSIYPTINMFSNMDLMTGEKYKSPTFFISRNFKETQSDIKLSGNISLNKSNLSLDINGKKVTIRRLVTTKYLGNQEFKKEVKYVDFSSNLSLIYMSAYKTFVLVDEKTYNSLYIQLFVLEEYDKTLFEKVIANPHSKIYKLKI